MSEMSNLQLRAVIDDTIASLKRHQDEAYRFRDEAANAGKAELADRLSATGFAYGHAAQTLRDRRDGKWGR